MFHILARGCLPGPFPGWCDAPWLTLHPSAPGGGCVQALACVTLTPDAATWWTPAHIAWAAIIGLCAVIVLGAVIAIGAQNVRNARRERMPGGRP